jgi:hypothetical protein
MLIHRIFCLAGFVGLMGLTSSAEIYPPSSVVPGHIFDPASDPSLVGNSPLDPNGDGWITSGGIEFSGNILEESDEFEGSDWRVIWHYGPEPTNDLATGASCGISEIVDNQNTGQHAAYYRFIDPDNDPSNRNEQLVFRMRIADEGTGAFGYSILVDTDQKFGSTGLSPDLNAVSGNPGFEIEILYGSGGGNSGVTVQNVDGITSGFTELAHYAKGVRNQRSYAKFTNCASGDPVFLDFYIDVDDFPAGVTAATPLRFVFATSSSPSTALGGSASDIGGVDDGDPALSDNDAAFTTVVNSTPVQTFSTGALVCTDVWYLDADGDGLGVLLNDSTACTQPVGYVSDSTDLCDDNTACNYDANSVTNAACEYGVTWYVDSDGDGYGDASITTQSCTQPAGYVANGDDCDDTTSSINPGETETCNGTDNNCSGDESDAVDMATWYLDSDSDGYGDALTTTQSCTQPSGYVANGNDCDDSSSLIHPGAVETCDGIDNNCSGDETDAADAVTWYVDSDGDGYGDASITTQSCTQPAGYVANGDDCDDTTSSINPGETETCNGTDNNCSGDESDAVDIATWYLDADGDGLGVLLSDSTACTQPAGFVSDSTDLCDDNTACNYDGNSVTNAACTYATTWYADSDGDGLGDSNDSQSSCTQPTGYVNDDTDQCDDTTALNYNSESNPACEYPASTLLASIIGCDGQDDLTFDLDTIHSYTGVTSYSISTGITGSYASASISGSEMTFNFSGEGVGSDTLYVTASGSGPSQQLKLYFEEAEYPVRTSPIKALAASAPGANDGGLQVSLSGTYDQPVTLHMLGHEDTPIVNGIAQSPYGTHMITGFTNVKGCRNDEPMSLTGPSGSPTPARLMVPCVPCSPNP